MRRRSKPDRDGTSGGDASSLAWRAAPLEGREGTSPPTSRRRTEPAAGPRNQRQPRARTPPNRRSRKSCHLALASSGTTVAAVLTSSRRPEPARVEQREAPWIDEEPGGQTALLFRSLDAPNHLTVIANWIRRRIAAGRMVKLSDGPVRDQHAGRRREARRKITVPIQEPRGHALLGKTVQDYTVRRSRAAGRHRRPPRHPSEQNRTGPRQLSTAANAAITNGTARQVFACSARKRLADIGASCTVAIRKGTGTGLRQELFAGTPCTGSRCRSRSRSSTTPTTAAAGRRRADAVKPPYRRNGVRRFIRNGSGRTVPARDPLINE